MPEETQAEQASETDVNKGAAAEVATPAPESSTGANDAKQADAARVANAEQTTDKPEDRSIPLAQHIAERQKLKAKIRELEEKAAKPAEPPQRGAEAETQGQSRSNPDQEPTLEACDYDPAKFYKEMRAFEKRQEQKEAQSRDWNAKASDFDQRAAKYAAEAPEYDKLIQDRENANFGDPLIDATVIEEGNPALDHYLLHPDNEAELERIKALPDRVKLRELGKLSAKADAWAARKKGATKPITNAPAPVGTVAGGGRNSLGDWRYDGNLDAKTYRERMLAD